MQSLPNKTNLHISCEFSCALVHWRMTWEWITDIREQKVGSQQGTHMTEICDGASLEWRRRWSSYEKSSIHTVQVNCSVQLREKIWSTLSCYFTEQFNVRIKLIMSEPEDKIMTWAQYPQREVTYIWMSHRFLQGYTNPHCKKMSGECLASIHPHPPASFALQIP